MSTRAPGDAPTPDWDRVELVVVGYHSRDHVEAMLASLPADLRVVAVDNSDGADGLGELVRTRTGGRYLSGGGIGFARAANLGARTSTAEVLFFVKPTARPTVGDLAALVGDVHAHPESSVSGGVLVDEDGTAQIGVAGWEPSLRRAAVHALGLHTLLPRAGIYARPVIGSAEHVDWVNGGLMAVRRDTFLELGCFDEEFFLYNEDVGLGRAGRAKGLVPRLRTDVAVHSVPGGSGAPPLEMWRLRGASLSRYLHKHRGATAARLAVLVLATGFTARTAAHLLQRDADGAAADWAYTTGLVTGRGYMGGRLVMSPRRRRPARAGTAAPSDVRPAQNTSR